MYFPARLLQALDQEEGVALVLDREGVIRFTNAAWEIHAHRDGAPDMTPHRVIGRPYLDFVFGALQSHVRRCLSVATERNDLRGVDLHSECSTPDTLRLLSTHFAPLRAPDGTLSGVVVRHSLRAAGPLAARYVISEAAPESFRDDHGIITQCGCCRRVREPLEGGWKVCLPLLKKPRSDLSHGLCESCLELYYSDLTL